MMSTTTFGVHLYYNNKKFKMFVSGKSIWYVPLLSDLLRVY